MSSVKKLLKKEIAELAKKWNPSAMAMGGGLGFTTGATLGAISSDPEDRLPISLASGLGTGALTSLLARRGVSRALAGDKFQKELKKNIKSIKGKERAIEKMLTEEGAFFPIAQSFGKTAKKPPTGKKAQKKYKKAIGRALASAGKEHPDLKKLKKGRGKIEKKLAESVKKELNKMGPISIGAGAAVSTAAHMANRMRLERKLANDNLSGNNQPAV